MKLIFLDIDGVMNNWIESKASEKHESLSFADSCVDNLKYIIGKTGAKLVISSTWRIGYTVESLNDKVLSHYGLNSIDFTPVFCEQTRGSEINSYLKSEDNIDSFVILDDDSDMDDLLRFHVKTNEKHGLTFDDAKKAVKILNR